MTPPPAPARLRALVARNAVFAVFFGAGFTFASWAARIPTVQSELGLGPSQMGLLLLVGSAGSILSLPLAGRLVGRFGPRRTVGVSVVAVGVTFAATIGAVARGSPLWAGAWLFLALAAVGAMDVAMNYEGSVVEQRVGRSIMPHFHGCFSLGTIAGAGLGTILSRAGVALTTHVWSVLAAVVGLTLVAVTRFLPPAYLPDRAGTDRGGGYAKAWLEPRTLLVGLIVLSAALTEGAANDWLALGIREGFDVPEYQGAFGLTLFMTAMTALRFAGTRLLERFGRVAVLRACTAAALAGLAAFVFAPTLPLALAWAFVWGLGAALGFTVGMSAASDEPLRAAARLSVISTIGYGAFLIGPPALGFLAEHVGYRPALLALAVLLLAALAVMGAAAPARGSE